MKRKFDLSTSFESISTAQNNIVQTIKCSGLFDCDWYRTRYLALSASDEECIIHYVEQGASDGFFPNSLFDTNWYKSRYSIDSSAGGNPLYDFICRGNLLKRDPNPYFSTQFYLLAYPDIGNHPDISNNKSFALLHYLRWGASEGRETGPAFWSERYNIAYPDVAASGLSAVAHYIHIGSKQGRKKFIYQHRKKNKIGLLIHSISRSFISIAFLVSLAVSNLLSRYGRPRTTNFRGIRAKDFFEIISVIRREPLSFSAFGRLHFFSFSTDDDLGERHLVRCLMDPVNGFRLFAADGCKELGLFEVAESLLLQLLNDSSLADLARFSLADLALLRAAWAKEFEIYQALGTYIKLPIPLDLESNLAWQDAHFSQVLELLNYSSHDYRDHKETWILYIYTLFRMESWHDMLLEIESFSGTNGFSECLVKPLAAAVNALPRHQLGVDTAIIKPILNNLLQLKTCLIDDAIEIDPSDNLQRRPGDSEENCPLQYTLIHCGRRTKIDKTITFESNNLMIGNRCTLIPQNGVVLSNDDLLIKSSTHLQPMHYGLFSPDLIAVSRHSALLGSTARPQLQYDVGCVIGFSSNYYHWITEDVSRIRSLRAFPEFDDMPIFVDKKIKPWQRTILDRLRVDDEHLVLVDPAAYLKIERLVIPPRTSRDMLVHPKDVHFLRDSFAPVDGYPMPTRGKRLYLSRSRNTVQRAFLNEQSVIRELRKHGFSSVDPSIYTIDDQIKLFSDAEIIVAPGGAALTNILFAPNRAKILVFAADAAIGETWSTIAASLGQDLILCTGRSYARPHHHLLWSRFAFSIEMADLKLALEALGL